jgi:hypothetical protein
MSENSALAHALLCFCTVVGGLLSKIAQLLQNNTKEHEYVPE